MDWWTNRRLDKAEKQHDKIASDLIETSQKALAKLLPTRTKMLEIRTKMIDDARKGIKDPVKMQRLDRDLAKINMDIKQQEERLSLAMSSRRNIETHKDVATNFKLSESQAKVIKRVNAIIPKDQLKKITKDYSTHSSELKQTEAVLNDPSTGIMGRIREQEDMAVLEHLQESSSSSSTNTEQLADDIYASEIAISLAQAETINTSTPINNNNPIIPMNPHIQALYQQNESLDETIARFASVLAMTHPPISKPTASSSSRVFTHQPPL